MEIQQELEINSKEKDDKIDLEELRQDKEIFENINSPKIIQEILQISTSSNQIGLQLENNIIKSLSSFNEIVLSIIDNDDKDINEYNFNPFVLSQNKRNNLYNLNFEEINFNNDFLNKQMNQYNELKQKLKEYKELKNNKEIKEKLSDEKIEENNNENKAKDEEKKNELNKDIINKKLFLVGHPLNSLFEDEINFKDIKNEIENEYLNKMKDNTNYKYVIPQQNNNLFGLALNNSMVDEEDEDEDNNNDDVDEISVSHHSNQDDDGSDSHASNISVESAVFYANDENLNANANVNDAPIEPIHNVNIIQNIAEINENNIQNIENQEENHYIYNNVEQNNIQNENEDNH